MSAVRYDSLSGRDVDVRLGDITVAWTLKGMAAALHDGHASGTRFLSDTRRRPAVLPAFLEVVEGGITVVATGDPQTFQRGDVIQTIDGRDADSLLAVIETRYSGSPQYLRARSLGQLGRGDDGQVMKVKLRREDQIVNLHRAPMEAIDSVITELSQARGVIFDLRGYPRNNHGVISHLLTAPDTSQAWMQVPCAPSDTRTPGRRHGPNTGTTAKTGID